MEMTAPETNTETHTGLISREDHLEVLKTWRSKREHSAASHIVYNLLRGKPADRGFCACHTRGAGYKPWAAFKGSIESAISSYFWFDHLMAGGVELNPIRAAKEAQESRERFKERFGIEKPVGLYRLVVESKNAHD